MLEIEVAGTVLGLHSSGAVWWPAQATLLVADAHFGKAVSFRQLGVPVPQGTTSATLAALSAVLAQCAAQRVVFLGDFLHSARAHAPATLAAIGRWRQVHAALSLTLVRGNHDSRAGDPPAQLGIEVVNEPLRLDGSPLALCHHPQTVAGAYALAGHLHPCVRLSGRGHDRLRLPCFWLGDAATRPVGVLPAFGHFTGMHPVQPEPGDRLFGIAGTEVRALPVPARASVKGLPVQY